MALLDANVDAGELLSAMISEDGSSCVFELCASFASFASHSISEIDAQTSSADAVVDDDREACIRGNA